ncbi:acyl-CoA thioesterase domain-containing protein, partial [Frankia sp. ACN1ag]|uniref:acyl-CoA thioesterase domain-containing protein n=1 Tax=Frankia sp. ACN1ag TaxID=102891 RepID=UPI001F3612A3
MSTWRPDVRLAPGCPSAREHAVSGGHRARTVVNRTATADHFPCALSHSTTPPTVSPGIHGSEAPGRAAEGEDIDVAELTNEIIVAAQAGGGHDLAAADVAAARYEPDWVQTLFTLPELLRVLDLTPALPTTAARCVPSGHGGVLGAQQLGQQVVLAERLASGKRLHTLQTVFIHGGRADLPLEIDVERLAGGRSVESFALSLRQGGDQLSRAQVMLTGDAPDLHRFDSPAADLGRPADAEPVRRALLPWEAAIIPRRAPRQLDLWT